MFLANLCPRRAKFLLLLLQFFSFEQPVLEIQRHLLQFSPSELECIKMSPRWIVCFFNSISGSRKSLTK